MKPFYTTSYALVIGINSYADPRFVTLGEAEADAEAVAQMLASLQHNFQVEKLIGPQATRAAILNALYDLRSTDLNDRILVYFAGHGFMRADRLGNETGYIAPFDANFERDYTAIELNDVTALRGFAGAKHIGFIFDACFSGQALGLTRSTASNKFMTRRAYQVISAGAGDQTVSDYNSMTELLVRALGPNSPHMHELYTFSDLGLYLRQTMARDTNHSQIPQFGHLTGSEGGELVLFNQVEGQLPNEVEAALYARNKHVRQGAVAALIAIAKSTDEAQANVAREWLQRLSVSDLNPGVREAARSFFEEQHARSKGDQDLLDLALSVQKQAEEALETQQDFPALQAIAQGKQPDPLHDTKIYQRLESTGVFDETRPGTPNYRRPTKVTVEGKTRQLSRAELERAIARSTPPDPQPDPDPPRRPLINWLIAKVIAGVLALVLLVGGTYAAVNVRSSIMALMEPPTSQLD